jgi:hypothetical protein
MNIKEIKAITKEVINNSIIESSSDFIMVAYELHKRFYEGISKKMECVLTVEGTNYHDSWPANCVYTEEHLKGLTAEEMYDCMIAYRIYLDYFLNDETISEKFYMDEDDHIGWQIYKELDIKYNWCKNQLNVLNYIKEAQPT